MAHPLVILYHFLPILPMILYKENTNQSIKKMAMPFLQKHFAILFPYVLEY